MTLPILTSQRNSAVVEPRTGHFQGLAGFEAKAEDFKLCPRGQEPTRGLHFWHLDSEI